MLQILINSCQAIKDSFQVLGRFWCLPKGTLGMFLKRRMNIRCLTMISNVKLTITPLQTPFPIFNAESVKKFTETKTQTFGAQMSRFQAFCNRSIKTMLRNIHRGMVVQLTLGVNIVEIGVISKMETCLDHKRVFSPAIEVFKTQV